jgi:hypothetical protein
MALHIETERPIMSTVMADRRLYLTADRSRIVEHDDPEAAILFAAEGTVIEQADAERYGLLAQPVAPVDTAAPPSDPPAAPRTRRK